MRIARQEFTFPYFSDGININLKVIRVPKKLRKKYLRRVPCRSAAAFFSLISDFAGS